MEFTLLNGKCRKSGKVVSLQTGKAESFSTFTAFLEALKQQFAYITRAVVKANHAIDEVSRNRPCPALSLIFRECIENASDYAWGGAKYNTGNGVILIGVADLINSVTAIKHLVFDTKDVAKKKRIS